MSRFSLQNQIKPTRENLAKILAQYNITDFDFKLEPTGVENSTFIIITKGNKYALRVYRQKRRTEKEIKLEIDYINFLFKNNIPVPKIISNTNKTFISKTEIGSYLWFSILMEFIEGKHPRYYPKSLLKELAHLQTRMHLLANKFQSKFIKVLEVCDTNKKVKDFLFTNLLSVDSIDISGIENKRVKDFVIRAKRFTFNVKGLPTAIIQKDIHADNILVKDNKLAGILDFDDLFNGGIVISLAFTLWDIYVENKNLNHLKYYFQEYNAERKLTSLEISKLKDFILFRNYIMGTAEFLIGGEESSGKFLMPIKRYLETEDELSKLKEKNLL